MRWKTLPGLLGLAAAMLALADDAAACGRRGRPSCGPAVVIPCDPGFGPFVIVDGVGRDDKDRRDGRDKDRDKDKDGRDDRRKPTRLKAFLIIDTSDPLLRDHVRLNEDRLLDGLRRHLGDRLDDPTVLTGDELKGMKTGDILKRLEGLRVDGPTDGVLFYYAGHGGYDDKEDDQVFEVNGEKESYLRRKEVVRALKDKKPRLLVVLSDACAGVKSYVPVKRAQAKIDFDPASKAFARLFLDYEGEYIANGASKGQLAWYQDKTGGLYTFALCKEAAQGEKTVKDSKEGSVTWDTFQDHVAERTQQLFKDMKDIAGDQAPPTLKDQATQTPQAKNDTRLIPGTGRAEARAPRRTTLTVHAPPDARLFIDGEATAPTGEERRFSTEVWPGQTFEYELRVVVERAGRQLALRRTVTVRAGASVEADFRAEAEAATARAEREADAAGRFARKEE
jgi:uncharacterized protein (TIGR03000 family)